MPKKDLFPGKRNVTAVTLPHDIHQQLIAIAAKHRRLISDMARELIIQGLEREQPATRRTKSAS